MNISVKKFSKKSLSLLIALIMVFSALPLTPPISADAAEVKTNIDVWDASRAGADSNTDQYRYSYADSQTHKTLSGIQWDGLTHNSTYLTVNNSALSFAEINTTGVITGNDNIADKGIRGNKWSFSAKFAYTGSSTKTTVFGLSSTTKRNYDRSNDGGGTGLAYGYVADLVDIRADGTVYINDNWTSTVNGILPEDLVAKSATVPKTLTVTYDNGNLTIDIDGKQKISQPVNTDLFSAGVGNYLAGPNVQVFAGGTAPYYRVSNESAYLRNFNLYSLSGATYQTTGGGSEPTAPTNKTISVIGYGILKNSGKDNRASNNVLGIVNDQQDANFDIGFVNFDISSLSNSEFNVASAIYNMTYTISTASSDREAKGLSFYYATRNNDAFDRTDQPANFTNTTYDSNIYGTANQHIANATSYLGLVNIGSVNTEKNKTNAPISVDLAPAIKYALKKGETRFQLLIMLKEAGGNGGPPWTDTNVTVPTTPVSVTMQTDADYVKANINVEGKVNKNYSNIVENNAGAYTSNVIVADQWTASQNNTNYLENNQIASDNLRFYAYNNAVALYTGAGNVRFPIVFEKVAVSNPSNFDVYQNIEYTALNNGGLFSLGNDNNQWQYCTSSTNLTDAVSGGGEGQVVSNFSNSTTASKDSYRANGDNINYAKNDKFGTTTTKAFKNYIKYTGSGNSDTYYDKLSSPTFSYRADYAVFWKDRYWYLTNVHDKAFTLNSDFNCYVLNYKPLYDIVSNASFKNNYNQISQNSSKYSQEGLNNYYAVVADIIDFNLANEPMTSESEVEAVATKIKDLVTRYNSYKTPELNQYTVTFYDIANGPKGTLKVAPGTTINESQLPALTTPKYNQNNQHYIYYWKNSDNTEFTVPYTVNDNVDISESRKIENCHFEVKSISGNTSTVSCSVCNGGTYTLDIEGYNNIVSVAREAINDTVKYDSASRAYLQTVLNDNNTVNDCITIEQVNAKISAIQTAINALDLNQYSITVNYVDENGKELAVGEEGATYKTYDAVDYGTIQNIVAPTNYNKVDYAVYKWTREDKSNSSISGLNSSSLDVVVKGASTYYVFLKKTSVDESQASGNAVITLNNKSNKVYDIGYVDLNENTPVSVSKNTITIGTVTLTAPNYSFYNITGFNINGKIITGTDTVSITKDTVIRPVYEAKQTVRITRASAGILINGNDDDSVDVEWNKKIVMTYNGAVPDGQVVIWKDGNGNVLAQGSTYSFYANSNVTISATVEASAPTDPTASIGFFSYDATDNKVTVVNNFYVPDGKTATKAGVILSTKNSTREALIAQTNGKFEGDESQFTTDKNQIRISVSRTANTSFTMYALAYVVVGDKTYYAPTVQSITYTVTNS